MKLPTWKQAFIILGGAVAIAFCACFGFMVSTQYADASSFGFDVMVGFGIVAIVCLFVAIPYSLIVMFIRFVRALKTPQAPPPPPPPPPENPHGPSA
jgi:hypothetical protein